MDYSSKGRSSTNNSTIAVATAATVTTALVVVALTSWMNIHKRKERAEYVEQERTKQQKEEVEGDGFCLPSVIEEFQNLQLNYDASIEEANKRRTANYYEKARDAHMYDLVVGVRSYPRLRMRREKTIKKAYKYYREGTKSHRTVIVMCDDYTQTILQEARTKILAPLNVTHDIASETGVWIPSANVIPQQDLHVTVAIPWWWHTMRERNAELSQQLAARFRQALVVNMHHAFQIELERIVLLRGTTLVALWRCIGERSTQDGHVIYDRHGEKIDPFVALRRDIVRCFATEDLFEPLTYHHSTKASTTTNDNTGTNTTSTPSTPAKTLGGASNAPPGNINDNNPLSQAEGTNLVTPPPPVPKPRPKLERSNTIEIKTPGLGDHDGFIHTTLARLPLDCLSMTDVELAPIHRMCREATATYCGHRMVVDRYRFLETTGAGGESNPCIDPLYDETIKAPPRVAMLDGFLHASEIDLHVTKVVESSATIGAAPTIREYYTSSVPRVDSLFLTNDEYNHNNNNNEENKME